MSEDMRISEVAASTGVPVSTLRYYERLGLLDAARSPNGYRNFDENQLERLQFITAAKGLGLELPEIARLMNLAETGTCTGVKAALQPLLADQISAVKRQLRALSMLDEQLRRAKDDVDSCPESDEPCRSECAFDAFAKTTRTVT